MTKPNNSVIFLSYFKIFIYGIVTPSIITFGLYYATNDILKNTFKAAMKEALKEAFKESMSEKLNGIIDNKSIKEIISNKINLI